MSIYIDHMLRESFGGRKLDEPVKIEMELFDAFIDMKLTYLDGSVGAQFGIQIGNNDPYPQVYAYDMSNARQENGEFIDDYPPSYVIEQDLITRKKLRFKPDNNAGPRQEEEEDLEAMSMKELKACFESGKIGTAQLWEELLRRES